MSEWELPAASAALHVILEVNVQHCFTFCEQLIRNPGQEALTSWAWTTHKVWLNISSIKMIYSSNLLTGATEAKRFAAGVVGVYLW